MNILEELSGLSDFIKREHLKSKMVVVGMAEVKGKGVRGGFEQNTLYNLGNF